MPDRPSSVAREFPIALACALFAPAAQSQQRTLTSDVNVAVVDSRDAKQVAQGVRNIISSQVTGVDLVVDSIAGKLRIAPSAVRGMTGPLFVIDGVPLADGYGLTMLTRTLERIDLFRDAASTVGYGLRAAKRGGSDRYGTARVARSNQG